MGLRTPLAPLSAPRCSVASLAASLQLASTSCQPHGRSTHQPHRPFRGQRAETPQLAPMARLHSKRRPMHEINVVPYVDVMLVLLVIFMVTAPLVTPGVVELPSVSKAPVAPVAPLEGIIKEDLSVLLRSGDARAGAGEERLVAKGELGKLIRERQQANPDQPVLIA